MPTPTYTPLATTTLGSSVATVTFSSISQSYRDLKLVILAGNTANGGLRVRVNGDTGANYSYVAMRADAGGTASNSASGSSFMTISYNVYSLNSLDLFYSLDFMDYSATDKHKTVLSRSGNAPSGLEAHTNRWGNTAAITSIEIFTTGGNIYAGSTFALYGIKS